MTSPIKKIDVYVLKKFMTLFAGAFLVCLFVFIMQFLWRFVDDLVGKGLSVEVLARFFGYASITLVPMSLPLSILLTSLIVFGNMGEQLELTAMKSAGIPLRRIMMPLGIICLVFGVVSFIFQNNISPWAQKELTRMIATMKQTSPAIEIPEGVYYSGIPNVNLYVERKNAPTGMLYGVTIYKVDVGFENAQIVVADSARLETTADKHFLRLDVYDGEQFENLQSSSSGGGMLKGAQVPYDRETFKYKSLLIDFNSDFDLMDADLFSGMAKVKNLQELQVGYDSIMHFCDSIGREYSLAIDARYMHRRPVSRKDSAQIAKTVRATRPSPDSVFARMSPKKQLETINNMQLNVNNALTDLEWEKPVTQDAFRNARKHMIEWHKKWALALSCIIFFLIGAPLGAIIRKGGMGLPVVVSVIIFLIYYVIDTSGTKLARDGTWIVQFGMWISTLVLAPVSLLLTYKANNDSVVFNADLYMAAIRRFFGIRQGRLVTKKEVIIETPDYATEQQNIEHLTALCQDYLQTERPQRLPNYLKLFFTVPKTDGILALHNEMEGIIERLSNTRDLHLLDTLGKYPELSTGAHTLFNRQWINMALGIIVPVGLIFWIRVWRFSLRLYRDLKQIIKLNDKTSALITKIINQPETNEAS